MIHSPHVRAAGVIFDLDGTLLDTMTAAPAAYADTLRALGGPDLSPADIVAAWHIGPTPAVLAHFLGRPTSAEDIECFYRHFKAAVAAVRPFRGVVEMLDSLSRAGYRLGVFTSATRRATTRTLSATGLGDAFSTVTCGDEVSRPKPAPEGLRLACHRLDLSTAAAVYVGDAEVDLQCAEAAGVAAIQASWDVRTTKRTTAHPIAHPIAHAPHDVVRLVEHQVRNSASKSAASGSCGRSR